MALNCLDYTSEAWVQRSSKVGAESFLVNGEDLAKLKAAE